MAKSKCIQCTHWYPCAMFSGGSCAIRTITTLKGHKIPLPRYADDEACERFVPRSKEVRA